MAAMQDDCERTATVALPTATSPGFISGGLGTSAELDAFSTMYELPLTRFQNGQTNKQTTQPRFTLRPCKVIMYRHNTQTLVCVHVWGCANHKGDAMCIWLSNPLYPN